MTKETPTLADKIEQHAVDTKCERHRPDLRACQYDRGMPCSCRAAVASA